MTQNIYRQLRSLVSHIVAGHKEYSRLQAAMAEMLQLATPQNNTPSLLDVGCGSGGDTLRHAQILGVPIERIAGVEFNPDHLAIAQSRFRAASVDLERDALPFADASFDVVICNQVLEHIKNIFWVLAEMDRVLTVGGTLAIGIPNLTSLLNRPILLLGRQPVTIDIEGPHVRAYAHYSFRAFLLHHPGYDIVTQLGSSLYPWPAKLGAERLARHLPGLSAYTFYALHKRQALLPCPWLRFGIDGETSYTHTFQNSNLK